MKTTRTSVSSYTFTFSIKIILFFSYLHLSLPIALEILTNWWLQMDLWLLQGLIQNNYRQMGSLKPLYTWVEIIRRLNRWSKMPKWDRKGWIIFLTWLILGNFHQIKEQEHQNQITIITTIKEIKHKSNLKLFCLILNINQMIKVSLHIQLHIIISSLNNTYFCSGQTSTAIDFNLFPNKLTHIQCFHPSTPSSLITHSRPNPAHCRLNWKRHRPETTRHHCKRRRSCPQTLFWLEPSTIAYADKVYTGVTRHFYI